MNWISWILFFFSSQSEHPFIERRVNEFWCNRCQKWSAAEKWERDRKQKKERESILVKDQQAQSGSGVTGTEHTHTHTRTHACTHTRAHLRTHARTHTHVFCFIANMLKLIKNYKNSIHNVTKYVHFKSMPFYWPKNPVSVSIKILSFKHW